MPTAPLPEPSHSPHEILQTDSSENTSSVLESAYQFIHDLGKRWQPFGDKFRSDSFQSETSWIKRKSRKTIKDLRKMY